MSRLTRVNRSFRSSVASAYLPVQSTQIPTVHIRHISGSFCLAVTCSWVLFVRVCCEQMALLNKGTILIVRAIRKASDRWEIVRPWHLTWSLSQKSLHSRVWLQSPLREWHIILGALIARNNRNSAFGKNWRRHFLDQSFGKRIWQ